MRNRNDKQAFIVDSEKKAEGEPGKHAFPDGVVEERKRVGRAHNPHFRLLYCSQESPSKALAPPFVEPGGLEHLIIGLRMVDNLHHLRAESAERTRACT